MLELLNEEDVLKNYRFYWIYKGKKEYKKTLLEFQYLIKNLLNKKNIFFKFDKEIIDINNIFLSYFVINQKNLNSCLNILNNYEIKHKNFSTNYYIEYKRVLIKINFLGDNINKNKIFLKFLSKLLNKIFNKLSKEFQNLKDLIFNKNKNKTLSYSEFRNLSILDINDSLLNFYRYDHFKIITNDFKNIKIGKIIDYFKNLENLQSLKKNLIEPIDIPLKINYPRHCDYFFWKNGNSFFANNIIYGFKKNINKYETINKMVDNEGSVIFSGNYYSIKKKMSDNEIKEIFSNHPITIKNNIILNGRHRVCAMIGRIISNQEYISINFKKTV